MKNENNSKFAKIVEGFKPAAKQNEDKSYRPVLIGLSDAFIKQSSEVQNALNTHFETASDAIKWARSLQNDIINAFNRTPEPENTEKDDVAAEQGTTDKTMLFKVDEVQTVPAEMGFKVEA